MKYIDEFRDGATARKLAQAIAREVDPGRRYRIMEFCGGHTHAIARYGIADLLPANVRLIHGPGCPVCVLPVGRIDAAIGLALEQRAILCTYGDTMRVPASEQLSLMKAKARGADIRMIYAASDCLKIAAENPGARSRVLRHRLRDDHPADRGRHPAGRSARARRTSRCSATTC